MGGNCANDGVPSKPTSVGRGRSDDAQVRCCNKRCLTCVHLVEGNSFISNITKKVSPNGDMDCGSNNVI